MIERCHCPKNLERSPSYKDVFICDEWRYLSNFIKWVDEQPNRDWQNCQLDKDFLSEDNKHYSPDTCVYIPSVVNKFILTNNKGKRGSMIGVTPFLRGKDLWYKSVCNNPISGKSEVLGYFRTELEAHLSWKSKKYEHACLLANQQNDKRVSEFLRNRYHESNDLTKL